MNKLDFKFLVRTIGVLIAFTILSGCDQVRQKLADVLTPPSPLECVTRVQRLVDAGDFQKAVTVGEDYLKDKNFASSELHLVVAKAYLELGDAPKALQHTQAANGEAESTGPSRAESVPEERVQKVQAGDASVTETSKGTVLKAGDASVVIPK